MSTEDGEGETAAEGRRIGRYELGEPVGPASYGGIYRAKVRSGSDTGRQVLARVVDRTRLDEVSVERLSSAGFSAMEVRDPRLAAVLDVVVEDDALAIISEWVDGVCLRDILQHATHEDTACPSPVAVRIALDLIDALQASKQHWYDIYPASEEPAEAALRSVVHGGVVPDSVVVATFGETMLCEAGVSGAAMTIEALRDSVGALCLRAPEQLNHRADERGDVFSVGVILWELIAGRSLFGASAVSRRGVGGAVSLRAGSPVEAMKRKLEGGAITRLETLPKLKDKVPKALSIVVARATDRDAKLRYVTLADLKKALTGLDVEPASVEMVAAYVAAVSGTPQDGGDTAERASNRPTKPPEEGDEDEDDRETAIPASLDVPPPPEEIASLAPEAPDDGDAHAVDFASMVAAADRHAPPPPDGARASGADADEPLPSEPGIDLLADDDEDDEGDDEDEVVSSRKPSPSEAPEPAPDRASSPGDGGRVAAGKSRGAPSTGPAVKRSPGETPAAKATSAEESSTSKVPFIVAAAVVVGVLLWVMSSGDGDAEPEPPTPAAVRTPAPSPQAPRAKQVEAPVGDDPSPPVPAMLDAGPPAEAAEELTEEDPGIALTEANPTPAPPPAPRPTPLPGSRAAPKPAAAPKKAFRPDDI